MKFLLFAALIAVAAASPVVLPGGAGPAPIITEPIVVDTYEPVIVGPAFVEDHEQIAVGPAVVNPEPIAVGPAVVESAEAAAPIIQIILNFNQQSQVVNVPVDSIIPSPVAVVEDAGIAVDPIQVAEVAPVPVEVIEVAPVEVGTPIIPSPVITLPEELN